jgi:hypothetical protein
MMTCPVCVTEVPDYRYEHPNGAFVQCTVCGPYRLMERAHQRLFEMRGFSRELTPFRRLSGALRQRSERGLESVLNDPEQVALEYDVASDLPEMIDRILFYVRAKAGAAGHKYVPLIGHRDYAVAGAEEPEAFDWALGKAEEQGYIERQAPAEAAYRLTVPGWHHLRAIPSVSKVVKRLFLSHAAADKPLAEFVAEQLKSGRSELEVFVASRAGDIRADQEWLRSIQDQLRAADAYLVLMTPNSEHRPWVWFETGAAWISGKRWIVARTAGVNAGDIPVPISINQVYALDDAEGARVIFSAMDVALASAPSFAEKIASFSAGRSTPPPNTGTSAADAGVLQPRPVKMSEAATELLIAAANSPDGEIRNIRFDGGFLIMANGRQFNDNSPRSNAVWKGALDELVIREFVEDANGAGTVYEVSQYGFNTADQLSQPNVGNDA